MFRLVPRLALVASAFPVAFVAASPAEFHQALPEPDPSLAFSTVVGQQTFINKGLVAFGLIPSNFRESTGDTLGGIGSAIALKRGSFKSTRDGSFTGTLVVQPDRGFNVDETVNYQGRQHQIDFVLTPYYNTSNLSFNDSQSTLKLTYKDTLLYKDRFGVKTSGLDPLAVRHAEIGFPLIALANPAEPIPNKTFSHLSLDAEGLVLNTDGTFWVSDEYGPYIHHFDHAGNLLQSLQPPDAILPRIKGTLNFTSVTDPDTGRVGNQGFEGLTLDETTRTLWALLQSATVQDGGDSSTTSRYTRLVGYDVRLPLIERPPIVAEYVVPLPVSKKNKTFAASELHFVKKGVFLVLSRDGHGHGDDTSKSDYKGIDLIEIGDATNIHNTKFDQPSNPIATKGVLDSSITPVTYTPFVNILNSTQLARFGLHNGDPSDATLIDGKWESIALASVGDRKYPDDYFLFTAADNDFITTQGISLGQPYNAGVDNDNQFLVYRVTLPSATARN